MQMKLELGALIDKAEETDKICYDMIEIIGERQPYLLRKRLRYWIKSRKKEECSRCCLSCKFFYECAEDTYGNNK